MGCDRRFTHGCLLVLMGLTACADPSRQDGMVARDSAGVLVVEHGAELPPEVPHWSLGADPQLTIGTALGDEPYRLTRIAGAGVLPGGEVFLAEWVSRDIRIFDSTGTLVGRFGRRGSGPAEFQNLGWVGADRAGTLTVHDATLRRLSRFSGGGDLLETIPLPSPPESRGTGGMIIGQFADGSLLMRWFLSQPGEGGLASISTGFVRDSIVLYAVTRDGSTLTPVGRFPGREDIRVVGRVATLRPAPFGRETVMAVADSFYYVGTQDRWEIAKYRQDGTVQGILRKRGGLRPVDGELRATWQRIRNQELADLESSPGIPAEMIEAAKYNAMPPTVPAHGAIRVDIAGNLWVQNYLTFPEQDSVTTWVVYGGDGAIRATATLPNLQIAQIGDTHIVLVWRDADGVPFVRVHELVKGREQ